MDILIKRGLSANVSSLVLKPGELALALDTNKLYAGNGKGKAMLNPDITPAVQEELDELERRHVEYVGRYCVTPIADGMSCELRIDFPVKSVKFGYFALAVDDQVYTEAVPVNQPILTNIDVLKSPRLKLTFYSLRDIALVDWEQLSGQSFDSLLNLRCYKVEPNSAISLALKLEEIDSLSGVKYGVLRRVD